MAQQRETSVWKGIQLFLSPFGFRLYRNQRYKGPIVSGGKITKAWADCGLGGDGGSDLIGYKITTITPDRVGKKIAIFTAIEAKVLKGKRGEDQKRFINMINNDGGIACFAEGENDVKKLLTGL